ncbi:hypothetical protein J3998_13020, partial [Thiomicrorhabdus sp. 6S2-11]
MKSKILLTALAAIPFLGLTACGGGGGSSEETPAAEAAFSGQVIDGYIKGMTCSADRDGDGVDDAFTTEPSDELGNFTIPGLPTPPNVAVTCVPGANGAEDMDNPGVPFTGILTAPAGYQKVTPISTLVNALLSTGKSLTEAEELAKSFLGLSTEQEFDRDYIASGDESVNTAAQAIHSLISDIDSDANYSELVEALAEVIVEKTEAGEEPNISDNGMSDDVGQKAEESNTETGDSNTETGGSTTEPADTTAPVITLIGSASITIEQGSTYSDSGATASDNK